MLYQPGGLQARVEEVRFGPAQGSWVWTVQFADGRYETGTRENVILAVEAAEAMIYEAGQA